ncbi:MAG: hypothetical protein ABWY71_02080 [Candidatus Saccharimonadales bacterium]
MVVDKIFNAFVDIGTFRMVGFVMQRDGIRQQTQAIPDDSGIIYVVCPALPKGPAQNEDIAAAGL